MGPTDFIGESEALEIAKRDATKDCTIKLIDSAEVGNDEGDDVLVVVVGIDHPALEGVFEAYSDSRFYVFRRGDDRAAYSGHVRKND